MAGFLADRLGKRDVLASTILMYSIGSLIAGKCSPCKALTMYFFFWKKKLRRR